MASKYKPAVVVPRIGFWSRASGVIANMDGSVSFAFAMSSVTETHSKRGAR